MKMVTIKCSKCGEVIVDTKRKYSNAVITYGYDLKPAEIGFELELVEEECLQCCNCGRKIPLRILKKKIKDKSVFDAIMYVVKYGK
ncbi:MAG: hypothetical protein Q9M37_03505 [Desulfonauticus sp.]|nr:hypothetical protein [Desulfonauticus sp.]